MLGLPKDTIVELGQWHHTEEFSRPIAQFKTVFWEPEDTESLRRLIRTTSLVKNKSVLEIGTGTGYVALCCLRAGARRVVATDINPSAIANAAYNADELNLSGRLELRLVPTASAEAYAVLGQQDQFDVIISNPPWEDRAARSFEEHAFYDKNFRLLRSLLRDLRSRLEPGGMALLAYGNKSAIRKAYELGREFSHDVRALDDRLLDTLPEAFLPGLLLKVVPSAAPSSAVPSLFR